LLAFIDTRLVQEQSYMKVDKIYRDVVRPGMGLIKAGVYPAQIIGAPF
jgi:hypothetical protein